ncbi:hypothetical protein J6590_046674 [Homalodisca vitripennis]|nr:hypothetical protein J6590_046674 [Homalodisca vitripennis]
MSSQVPFVTSLVVMMIDVGKNGEVSKLAGGAILTVGVWLNLDKKSFIAFTKIVESESQIPEFSLFGSGMRSSIQKALETIIVNCCREATTAPVFSSREACGPVRSLPENHEPRPSALSNTALDKVFQQRMRLLRKKITSIWKQREKRLLVALFWNNTT